MPLDLEMALETLSGESVRLGRFSGQVLLIVNVASRCGFTPQYQGLETLQRQFGPRGFSVLGFPCDQFGGQEPGDATQIAAYCEQTYDISFPLFAKIDVNGAATHPLFAALKRAAPGLLGSQAIKWNFTKFLVGRDSGTVRRYGSIEAPASIAGDIEAALQAP